MSSSKQAILVRLRFLVLASVIAAMPVSFANATEEDHGNPGRFIENVRKGLSGINRYFWSPTDPVVSKAEPAAPPKKNEQMGLANTVVSEQKEATAAKPGAKSLTGVKRLSQTDKASPIAPERPKAVIAKQSEPAKSPLPTKEAKSTQADKVITAASKVEFAGTKQSQAQNRKMASKTPQTTEQPAKQALRDRGLSPKKVATKKALGEQVVTKLASTKTVAAKQTFAKQKDMKEAPAKAQAKSSTNEAMAVNQQGSYIWVPKKGSQLDERFGETGIPAKILEANGGLQRQDGRWVFAPFRPGIMPGIYGLADRIHAAGNEGSWVGEGKNWVYVFGKTQNYASLVGKAPRKDKSKLEKAKPSGGKQNFIAMAGMQGMLGINAANGKNWTKVNDRWVYLPGGQQDIAGMGGMAGMAAIIRVAPKGGGWVQRQGRWVYVAPQGQTVKMSELSGKMNKPSSVKAKPDMPSMSGMKGMSGTSGTSPIGDMTKVTALLRDAPKGSRAVFLNGQWELKKPKITKTAKTGMSGMASPGGMSGARGMNGMTASATGRWMQVAGRWIFLPGGQQDMMGMGGMSGMAALVRQSSTRGGWIQRNGRWVFIAPSNSPAAKQGMAGMSGMSGMQGMTAMSGMSGMQGKKPSPGTPNWMLNKERKVAGGKEIWVPSGKRGAGRWRFEPEDMSSEKTKNRVAQLLRSAPKGSRVVLRKGRWVFEWPETKSPALAGMSGMSGMKGMTAMSGMSGMQGMTAMSGMSGMQGMAATSRQIAGSIKKSDATTPRTTSNQKIWVRRGNRWVFANLQPKAKTKTGPAATTKAVRSASLGKSASGAVRIGSGELEGKNQQEFIFFVPGQSPGTGSWYIAPAQLLKHARKVGNPAAVRR